MNEAIKHDLTDIFKVLGINGSAFALVTWGALIDPLKVISLGAGIIYTAWKVYDGIVRYRWRRQDRNE